MNEVKKGQIYIRNDGYELLIVLASEDLKEVGMCCVYIMYSYNQEEVSERYHQYKINIKAMKRSFRKLS